ncbi:MAG: RNA methyltransferase [Flavobacteriales bacterium]|nr:RNA methyltransferase [Flavobacteriales bacterium]
MTANLAVRSIRALHQRKQREEQGLFIVQGIKLVRELLASPIVVESIHATEEAARALNVPEARIHPAHDIERMGTLESGTGIIAVARIPAALPPRVPSGKELVLALDGISDPGNMGTLLRIADWFGIGQVWCSTDCVEVYNPKCVQASMGSLFRVHVRYGDIPSAVVDSIGANVQVYKAEASGENVFHSELALPAVLLLGSESHGLRDGVRNGPGRSIAVPRFGAAESLNVAAAAAALCMEFARRR